MQISPWFPFNPTFAEDKYRLFCFAHSGAGASVFHQWMSFPSEYLEVCPVQLPGRESRYSENPLTNMPALLEELEDALFPLINNQTAFFGHSLGGYIAFECSKRFYKEGLVTFISASNPPDRRRKNKIYKLSDDKFIKEISSYGGIPLEILQSKELMEFFLPSLRADITLFETYSPNEPIKTKSDVVVLGGLNDPLVARKSLLHWQDFSSGSFSSSFFPGDHFYYQKHSDQVIQIVENKLLTKWGR